MCGITGYVDLKNANRVEKELLHYMANTITHRGPDYSSTAIMDSTGFGFKRLSIIDLEGGNQPFFSPDSSVMMICNGEIFNYKELRKDLIAKGHRFSSDCDVEVILYLYLEYGLELLNKLNGQFAFAIYDKKPNRLFMARDHFGICPLFYTVQNDYLIFGSEIKAILKHPEVERGVDLKGLDQIFSLPANVSPTTMFKDIHSLKPGSYLILENGQISEKQYWDLEYPNLDEHVTEQSESWYAEKLEELLIKSVNYRLNSDVPLGFYLSGGLDSSLLGGIIRKIDPHREINSFSIAFPGEENEEIDESSYQKLLASSIDAHHTEIDFNWSEINQRLEKVIYHSETPLRETYNTCSLALSEALRERNIKVTLCGEGSDEIFGGYFGYKFDQRRKDQGQSEDLEDLLASQFRQNLWGVSDLIYEQDLFAFREVKQALYSEELTSCLNNDFMPFMELDKNKIIGKHHFNQRSYLDFKIRLAGHLIADHGDRMTNANSVEGRYPFLDIELVEFVKTIPPHFKLNEMIEKYILKKVSEKYVPSEIINRQKFGFVAPGSPQILSNNREWLQDTLSFETIKRQGYFNPSTIEWLKKRYLQDGFHLNVPYESDLLLIVLTFGMFLEIFELPGIHSNAKPDTVHADLAR